MGMIHISLQAATIICLWQKSHTACLEQGYGRGSMVYVADNGTDRKLLRDGRCQQFNYLGAGPLFLSWRKSIRVVCSFGLEHRFIESGVVGDVVQKALV